MTAIKDCPQPASTWVSGVPELDKTANEAGKNVPSKVRENATEVKDAATV